MQFSQHLKPQNQSVMLKPTRLQCDVQKLKTKVQCSKQEHQSVMLKLKRLEYDVQKLKTKM
jgi:hypothetical protein